VLTPSSNLNPQVGLAVVDSMLLREIKAFGSHAQGIYGGGHAVSLSPRVTNASFESPGAADRPFKTRFR
jgi:hypothetical protein